MMRKESMHHQVEIIYSQTDQCPMTDSSFNFFQFVHIVSGSGSHEVNGNRITYQAGSFLLITPNDYHAFYVETLTEFLIIRFTNLSAIENSFRFSILSKLFGSIILFFNFKSKSFLKIRFNKIFIIYERN